MYNMGLIGNCQASALVRDDASIVWMCLPRPDSEPIFGELLDQQGGRFQISSGQHCEPLYSQFYISNTNVLVTTVTTKNGDQFSVTDFFPRFEQSGRMYRPQSLFRIVEPLAGAPVVRVACRPINGWTKDAIPTTRGSSHVRWSVGSDTLRLTTNMPLTYLNEEMEFPLREKLYFAMTYGVGLEGDLVQVSENFLRLTTNYWRTWVKHCSIPTLYQQNVIRSALTLKLHCYEDTGAIMAAFTTSLPEEPGGERNWDYRFCWLRDAYFTVSAFHNLGHFEEMEGFLKFLLDVAHDIEMPDARLAPVYNVTRGTPTPEIVHPNWAGYLSSRPVRSCNQAAEHIQNDVYGEMILTLSPIFFDERFLHLRSREHEGLLIQLGKRCLDAVSKPDAGLWEFRDGWREHSFSNLMCWAGLDRVSRLQHLGLINSAGVDFHQGLLKAERAIVSSCVDGAARNGPLDHSFDASLSLLSTLRFTDRSVVLKTLDGIEQALGLAGDDGAGFFYRYLRQDDFGKPASAFVVCSFWLAQGFAMAGQVEKGRIILDRALRSANGLGLFAEHFQPSSGLQLGNFPQTYSHVGLINAAFSVSPPWSQVL